MMSAAFSSKQETNYEVLMVRSPGDLSALANEIRNTVASIDPDVPVTNVMPYDNMVAKLFMIRKLGVLLISTFAGATVLLSAIGLYGLLAYAVSQRRREFGVRIALGAQSTNLLKLIARQALGIVTSGVVIGLTVGLTLTRLMAGMLYGVSPEDPTTVALSLLVLGLAALLACLTPALRAIQTDPITALRE
jgi:ABC-type antimicrobial peptide transport system permease subunit